MTKLIFSDVIKAVVNINQKGIISWIVILIVLIGIAVAVFLVQNYTRFLPKAANVTNTGASLTLTPSETTINKGCEFNLDITVNTGGYNTNGTDAVIKYNPTLVTALSVENGSFYPTYPGNVVDNTSGRVMVSGISSTSDTVTGQGKLATVKFKVNPEATSSAARVYFDFDPQNPSKTNDSNIVESINITEVLKSVTDSIINIGSGTNCQTPSSSATPSPTGIEITAVIESGNKAVVNFKNIPSPTIFDKLELLQSQTGTVSKKLISSIYTANCTAQEPGTGVQAKNSGTCTVNLPDPQGEYQFRLYQNSAESNLIKNTPPVSATNELTNPSMELITNGYPSNWVKKPNGISDTSTVKTGSRSLKVSGPTSFVYSHQNKQLQPGTQYTASVWIKTQNVTGKGVGIRYVQVNPTSSVIGQVLNIKDAANWKQISFTFNTPANYVTGRMDLVWELNSGATVWFDDASICKGSTPCP